MARLRPVQAFRDESLDLEARIARAIDSVGPRNVAQLARLTGAHQETIRYKIKKRFVGRGFRFQADVDFSKLGLCLYWANVTVHPLHYPNASRLFEALNREGYLIHFSKVLPGGYFVSLFAIPIGKGEELEKLLNNLMSMKIITGFSLSGVLVERHKPMDVAHFDFQKDRWEVDWQKIRNAPSLPLRPEKPKVSRNADEVDMLLIKELQIDGLQHVSKIAKKLKVNEKTLEYHYRTHVLKDKLVPKYRVRWLRDLTRTVGHAMLVVVLTMRGTDERSYEKLQNAVNRIPYLWVEYRLDGGAYVAILGVPANEFMEMMGYVNDELKQLDSKVETEFEKVGESLTYTIPYHMFSDGRWRFDADKSTSSVVRELTGGVEK